jgi:hypothetical protein
VKQNEKDKSGKSNFDTLKEGKKSGLSPHR